MAVRLSYKGWELRFEELPNAAQLESAYRARVLQQTIEIPVRQTRPLRRAVAPFGPSALARRHVWVSGGAFAGVITDIVRQMQGEVVPDWSTGVDGVVVDATQMATLDDLFEIFRSVRDVIPAVRPHGRLVFVRRSSEGDGVEGAATAAALEGFVRSLPNEVGAQGITVNMVQGDDPGPVSDVVAFFLSDHSAFVSRQTPTVGPTCTLSVQRTALVVGAPEQLVSAVRARLKAAGWSFDSVGGAVALAVVCGCEAEAERALGHLRPDGRLVIVAPLTGLLGTGAGARFGADEALALASVGQPREVARCNGVAYGHVGLPTDLPAGEARFNALSQIGTPDDVAMMVEFLASPQAGGLQGQILRVCGGYMRGL